MRAQRMAQSPFPARTFAAMTFADVAQMIAALAVTLHPRSSGHPIYVLLSPLLLLLHTIFPGGEYERHFSQSRAPGR